MLDMLNPLHADAERFFKKSLSKNGIELAQGYVSAFVRPTGLVDVYIAACQKSSDVL